MKLIDNLHCPLDYNCLNCKNWIEEATDYPDSCKKGCWPYPFKFNTGILKRKISNGYRTVTYKTYCEDYESN